MKLIVGLGNPGKRYEKTRHNVGFMVLDALHQECKKNGISDWSLSKKFNATIAGFTLHGEKVILAKPMTFMNESGQSVGLIARYYNVTQKNIIVVHDDKDLLLGDIKIQSNRGDAGHNGIKSIIHHIQTKDFVRVRIGVANDKLSKKDTASFVLGKFGFFEKKELNYTISRAIQEIQALI